MKTKRLETKLYEVWMYDVWGNSEDGYDVNDRNCIDRSAEFDCFDDNGPTLLDIANYLDCEEEDIEEDGMGDEDTIYINEAKDGKPLCELIRVKE